jgi:hypothetical protein
MGFNQSSAITSAFTSAKSNDLFGEVLTGCLAGLGIWTKPSPKSKAAKPQTATNNVFPLRVIRVKDTTPQIDLAANAPKMAGRMVISGRMADVCAELDRLAA